MQDHLERLTINAQSLRTCRSFGLSRSESKGLIRELISLEIDPALHTDWLADTEIFHHTKTFLYGDINQDHEYEDLIKTYLHAAWDVTKDIYNNPKDVDDHECASYLDLWSEAKLTVVNIVGEIQRNPIPYELLAVFPARLRATIRINLQGYLQREVYAGIVDYEKIPRSLTLEEILSLPIDKGPEKPSPISRN